MSSRIHPDEQFQYLIPDNGPVKRVPFAPTIQHTTVYRTRGGEVECRIGYFTSHDLEGSGGTLLGWYRRDEDTARWREAPTSRETSP